MGRKRIGRSRIDEKQKDEKGSGHAFDPENGQDYGNQNR